VLKRVLLLNGDQAQWAQSTQGSSSSSFSCSFNPLSSSGLVLPDPTAVHAIGYGSSGAPPTSSHLSSQQDLSIVSGAAASASAATTDFFDSFAAGVLSTSQPPASAVPLLLSPLDAPVASQPLPANTHRGLAIDTGGTKRQRPDALPTHIDTNKSGDNPYSRSYKNKSAPSRSSRHGK